HDLHRAPGVDEQALQPVRIAEDQVGPLVGRKPAAEADGQGVMIEQRPRAYEVQGLFPLVRPTPPRLFPDAPHQMGLELVVHRPACAGEKVSCPAGTGVWVVNTLVARTRRPASANEAPLATSSRTRSTSIKAACPSFACHTAGSYPKVRNTRTPPTPKIHSW